MDSKKIGELIYKIRKEKQLTQKQLGEKINVCDKTISKWERGLGCPDISLISKLSEVLNINIEGLLEGQISVNSFVCGNMKKTKYYVCPVCGNITVCTGDAEITCCSRRIRPILPKKADEQHTINVSITEDEWYIESSHEMKKDHYISFIAFVTGESLQIIKQYPEWNVSIHLPYKCHGVLLWYCTKHGLFYKNI